LSIGYANTILGVSRFGGIAVAISCGFLVDRFSLKKIIFAMMLLTGIFTVLLGVASIRWVGIFLFLQAVVVTGFFPLGLVSMARMFDREIRGLATGVTLTVGSSSEQDSCLISLDFPVTCSASVSAFPCWEWPLFCPAV